MYISDQFKILCDKFLNKELAQIAKSQVDLRDRSKKGMRYGSNTEFLSPNAYKFMQNIEILCLKCR